MDFGDYSVKNIKSFIGMEGYGFNANLYRGKKKIAFLFLTFSALPFESQSFIF